MDILFGALAIFGAVGLVVALLLWMNASLHQHDQRRQKKISIRLTRLDLEHIAHAYTPNCGECNGKGWVEKRSGALVHSTSRVDCSCRTYENWLLALIDKWIEEGDVHHAAELLLVLKEKI